MDNTYCVRKRRRTGNKDIRYVKAKNGRMIMKSKCSSCGITKTRFVKKMKGGGLGVHKALTKVVGN